MNKYLFLLIASILILAPSQGVEAAIFDWISNPESSFTLDLPEKNWSFDEIYSGIQEFNLTMNIPSMQQNSVIETSNHQTPKTKSRVLPKNFSVIATGYSSTIDQTDSSPFITAAGTHVRDGVVAANFLPMGTVIKIPEIYGDKIFVVEDRMNKRYWYNIDIWFPERNQAITFGVKKLTIEII